LRALLPRDFERMGPHQYHLHQVELLVDIYVDFRSRQMDDLEEFVESFKKQIPGTFGLISVIRKDNSAIFIIHFGFVLRLGHRSTSLSIA
jgi:hypothetical protein